MRKLIATTIVALAAVGWVAAAQDNQLPGAPGSVKFAVLGDNMYGRQRPQDYVDKFERPYGALLQAGVPFFAALGNHDDPQEIHYEHFNMRGRRY